MSDELIYTASASFEAARKVLALPEGHRARRLHGHSFVAKVRAREVHAAVPFPGGEVGALKTELERVVAPLDYRLLNELLEEPTDENLARLVWAGIGGADLESVGIRSTHHQGVDLNRREEGHIWRRYRFDSAHRLPHVRAGHKCARMHGHGFEVILHARQGLRGHDLGVDYERLDALWAPLHQQLDQRCLNDIAGLENPTSEMLSQWVWQQLKVKLPELSWVTVYETASCGAHFDGTRFRIWKDMTLDSAVRLARAPKDDRRGGIHGHTFTLRLHLAAPLDEVLGWTIDFGDVKDAFEPLFLRLDHRPLYEIESLADTDFATLARWVRQEARILVPEIDRIDLVDASGAGVMLSAVGSDPAFAI